jgi:predicted small secreted protein
MRTLLMAAALTFGLTRGACNTVRGVGQDVQSAADATDNAIHGR